MAEAAESAAKRSAPDAHESAWLAAMDELDAEAEVVPGVTIGDLRAFYTRPRTPRGSRFRRRVRYGTGGAGGRPLTLSLYSRSSTAERRPSVVFVHGGGWAGGDPYMHIPHAHALAARGYVAATISYRLYPEARWPDPLEDAKAAVRWLRANAHRIGADPDRIAIAGGSAGGHLAAMVALTPGHFEGDGGNAEVSSAVQAAALWYPAVDMERLEYPPEKTDTRRLVEAFLGEPLEEQRRAASPAHKVTADAPPILTMSGTADLLITTEMLGDFHRALDRAGVPNRLELFEGRGHAFDLVDPADWQACFDCLADFLAEHLRST